MKTILLLRHSEPIKDRTLPTAELPLSEQGYRKAQELFSLKTFHSVQAVYTSPYRRATSTAEKLRKITYQGSIVVDGSIATPSAFVLEFENEWLSGMKYLDKEDSCSR